MEPDRTFQSQKTFECLKRLLETPSIVKSDNKIAAYVASETFDQDHPSTSSTSIVVKKSKRYHVQYSAAENCKINRFDDNDLSFFRFPIDEERRKQGCISLHVKM